MGKRKFATGDLIKQKYSGYGYIVDYKGNSQYECAFVNITRNAICLSGYDCHSTSLSKAPFIAAEESLNALGQPNRLLNAIGGITWKSPDRVVGEFRQAYRYDRSSFQKALTLIKNDNKIKFPPYEFVIQYKIDGWWKTIPELELKAVA